MGKIRYGTKGGGEGREVDMVKNAQEAKRIEEVQTVLRIDTGVAVTQ